MKYKRLVDDDGIYNKEGKEFIDEYKALTKPLIEKYMLLGFDSNDIECIVVRNIMFLTTELMMKRKFGISPFDKKD